MMNSLQLSITHVNDNNPLIHSYEWLLDYIVLPLCYHLYSVYIVSLVFCIIGTAQPRRSRHALGALTRVGEELCTEAVVY